VHSPARCPIGQGRAVCEQERDLIVEKGVARPRGHGHVGPRFLTRGESLKIRVSAFRLGLRLLPGRVNARDMTEPDGIENWRRDRGGEARLVAASLKNPEGPRVGFGGGGEGLEVQRLLAGGPDVVNPVDKKCLLRARRHSLNAGTVSVG